VLGFICEAAARWQEVVGWQVDGVLQGWGGGSQGMVVVKGWLAIIEGRMFEPRK